MKSNQMKKRETDLNIMSDHQRLYTDQISQKSSGQTGIRLI